jgi:chromate transporter
LSNNVRSAKAIRDLAGPFLRLGFTAFGGPAAHVAMMEQEFVRRRRWLTREEFLDMLGASNLVPGPSSTEMAIHIGHQRAGWAGLLVAGVCFILPAMVIVMGCAWAYATFGSLPRLQGVLYGVKPVIIALVLQALWLLARTAIKNRLLAALGVIAAAGALAGGNLLMILITAGAVAALREWIRARQLSGNQISIAASAKLLMGPSAVLSATMPFSLPGLFLIFVKFGAVVFGSGYVLLAFLQADLVDRLHWLTQSQLLDAVAVGQVTPGPVFTTATFIGYLLGGVRGAMIATVAIFLPGFVFVAASRPILPRIRRSRIAGAFLDGVNAGAVALMLAVTYQLGRAALIDLPTIAIAALSAVALLGFRINSVWLIVGGAVAGIIAA